MTNTLDYLMPDLSQRAIVSEIMDNETCDEEMLFSTLYNFTRINRFIARTRAVLRTTVMQDIRRRNAHEVSLLDIAAGGCDTAMWFARHCRRLGIACSIYCLDSDPRILRYARQACISEPSIKFIQADAREIGHLNITVDYAFTNHFLHHLPCAEIPAVLRAISGCCRHGFVIQDLDRHFFWYLGFVFMGSIFWRKGFTLADGLMSIRRGFRREDLKAYLDEAGIAAPISRRGLGHWCITDIPRCDT